MLEKLELKVYAKSGRLYEEYFSKKNDTREGFLQNYLSVNYSKLNALCFLIERVYDGNFKNIISFGSGFCVLEYLLKKALPEDTNVIATDVCEEIILKAKEYLPDIVIDSFDITKDDIVKFKNKHRLNFDVAVFLGSSYYMEDERFISFFRSLKSVGIKEIIDFLPLKISLFTFFKYKIKENDIIRKLFKKLPLRVVYKGECHARLKGLYRLRKLYKVAGFKIKKECNIKPYGYVAVLKSK
ncbi:MAG: hypothetical protein HY805_07740 [Nitrospirae bacterium]|nr:hypothetical protein [Nitrospirota bacterium]